MYSKAQLVTVQLLRIVNMSYVFKTSVSYDFQIISMKDLNFIC